MRLRHISGLLLLFSLAGTTATRAQPNPIAILDAADNFFTSGNDFAGVTECLRFLHADPDHPLTFYAHYMIGDAESRQGNSILAARSLRVAARSAPTEQVQRAIRYRMAFNLIIGGQEEAARLELYQLALIRPDTLTATKANLLIALTTGLQHEFDATRTALGVAAEWQPDNAEFRVVIDDARTVIDSRANVRPKSPRLAKWSSTLLPGSGQIYAGQPLEGLFAMSLNAGTTYLVVNALQQGSRINAFLLATNLWWRYYKGNRLHAEEAAVNANLRFRATTVDEVAAIILEAGSLVADDGPDLAYETIRKWYEQK